MNEENIFIFNELQFRAMKNGKENKNKTAKHIFEAYFLHWFCIRMNLVLINIRFGKVSKFSVYNFARFDNDFLKRRFLLITIYWHNIITVWRVRCLQRKLIV